LLLPDLVDAVQIDLRNRQRAASARDFADGAQLLGFGRRDEVDLVFRREQPLLRLDQRSRGARARRVGDRTE
jgi:hypothetical protein